MEKIVKQEVNEIFAPLWEKKARYYILMGGRGAGRSTGASQFVLSQLLAPEFFRCAIMRSIHSDIRHSLWRELNDRIDEQGIREALRITDNDMTLQYGVNTINAHGFRQSSGGHSAKLKSLANYNTVIIEEAEEVGEQEFMTLDDTLRTVKGDIRIVLLLNPPPKSHWIIQRWFNLKDSGVQGFYIPELRKDIDNAVYIHGTFENNIHNLDLETIKRYKAYQINKPAYYNQMIAGLVPETVRGKIYNGWEQIESVPDEARLVRFGEDYGWFPDPACVVAIYYWNGGYVIDELAYGTELSNEYLAGKIKEVGEALTIADSAEPKSIEEQKKYGIKIEGCVKGNDSVDYGIKKVSEKKIYVTKRSVNVWKSYENYAWKEDKDGNPLGEPEHEYSHAMDAVRYPLVSLSQNLKSVHIYRPTVQKVVIQDGQKVKVNRPSSYGWAGRFK